MRQRIIIALRRIGSPAMAPSPDFRFSLTPVDDLGGLSAQWRALEARADASFFQSWSWIGTWLASLPAGLAPLLARCDSAGDTVALGIIVSSRARRHLLWRPRRLCLNETGAVEYDGLFIEYNGFLTDRHADASVADFALRSLAEAAPRADEIALGGIDERVLAIAEPAGWGRVVDKSLPVFSLDLLGGGIADLGRFSKNTRQQIRRARREYEALGPIEVEAARHTAEALAFLDELKRLHQQYWRARGHPGAFGHPSFERFHRRLIAACHERDEIELLRIRAGSRTVGLLYNFVYRGRVYAYQSGFDYALLPHGRPGLLCHCLAIERRRISGARVYDFLAGDNRLKRSLSSTTTQLHWITWQRATPAARCERWLVSAVDRLRGAGTPQDSAPNET
jgi:CelD/BcsL family acetyltransferase involved in cellulose biosynthesis